MKTAANNHVHRSRGRCTFEMERQLPRLGDVCRSTCQRVNRDGTLSQLGSWSLETQAVDCRTRLLATKNHKQHKNKILSCELCAFLWLDKILESWIALSCIHAKLAHDCRRSIALLQLCLTGFVILTLQTLTQNKRNNGMHTKGSITQAWSLQSFKTRPG